MNYGFICGIFAVVMSSIGYIFQLYKIFSDKSGENLSYIGLCCIAMMNTAYIIYFISTMDIIGLIGSVIPLTLLIINMILKYYYSTKQKQVLIK